jgi:hypothetical protein
MTTMTETKAETEAGQQASDEIAAAETDGKPAATEEKEQLPHPGDDLPGSDTDGSSETQVNVPSQETAAVSENVAAEDGKHYAGEETAETAEEVAGLLSDALSHALQDDTALTEEVSADDAAAAPEAASNHEAAAANAAQTGLILAALKEATDRVDDYALKIDGIAADVSQVTDQLNQITYKYEQVSSEIESLLADNNSKSILSKTFLLISTLAVVALVSFQIYTFTELVSAKRQLNLSGRSVVENLTTLNKKMAEYDKNLTKALESPPPKEPAKQAIAETTTVNEKDGPMEVAPAASLVQEKINRLRNGLPEKRLIRKETGDWFIVNNKKNGECITDSEVIEALNNAYQKAGRSLKTKIPLPSHNSLCILKPDGKGGTEIVITKEFVN